MKNIFRNLSLRTQLIIILLFMLVITIGALTFIYSRSEKMLIERVGENFDDITQAIHVSVEEFSSQKESTERLKVYVESLKRKGIKEISIISDNAEVIASSNPEKIGTKEKITRKTAGTKKDFVITARLGEGNKSEEQRYYNVIMPVNIKGEKIGYILISMALDDYKLFQRRNHFKRIISTFIVFAIGIVISIFIAQKYTEPIKKIMQASKKIAEGELLEIHEWDRKDEIGILVKTFNEMVKKLREQKQLEEKLKKTKQLSIIGQLSSGMAHEIRNPLNFISLSIGHLREKIEKGDIPDKEESLKLLDNLRMEIHKINELIHNFLFLGKPVVLNKDWVAPEALIGEALLILKDKIAQGITIKPEYCNGGVPLYCDREFMRICLINLIHNALEAIEREGTVHVLFGREDAYYTITVTDTGTGIDEKDMGNICEPYFSTKKQGFGLGLSITKRLIEEHGGRLVIKSKKGEGTCVMIKVPYHER